MYQSWNRSTVPVVLFTLIFVFCSVGVTARGSVVSFATWGEESGWKPFVESFVAENPDVEVEIIALTWAEYWQKIDVMFAGGMPIDIMRLGGQHLPQFVDREMLLDLTPYVKRDFKTDEYVAPLLNSGMYKGVWYSMPEHSSVTTGFYNINLYNDAGLETPYGIWAQGAWNWDTFLELAKKLTRDVDGDGIIDQWGAHFSHALEPVWQGLVRSNRGRIYNDDYTRLQLDEPASLAGLKFLTDLTTVHRVMAPLGVGSQWSRGNLGFIIEKPSILKSWANAIQFEMGVTPVPAPAPGIETSAIVPNLLGISAASPVPEASWRLIAHLMGRQVQQQRVDTFHILSAHRQVVLDTIKVLQVQHADVLLDVANKSFPLQASLEYLRIEDILRGAIAQVLHGQRPIESAIRELVVPQANAILADAFAR